MITRLKEFIQGFLSRSGSSVFAAMLSARVLAFVASWVALQLVNEKDLGLVLYAYSFFVFLIPIGGFGLNQSYIRFAALSKNENTKNDLFIYTFKNGLIVALFFTSILILVSYWAFQNDAKLQQYFMILSFSLLSFYSIDLIKNYFRVFHKNNLYAWLEITYNIVLVLMVALLGYHFHAVGYSIAVAISPLIASLFFLPMVQLKLKNYSKPDNTSLDFWKYGFFAGLAGVATQLLFAIDMILLGNMLKQPEIVTHYKYVSLIPFSLLFIPSMFITADFVKLTEEIDQKHKIQHYIKNYWTLFSLVSFGVLVLAFIFPKLVLSIFMKNLEQYVLTFRILMVGVIGVLMFRGIFGNLLASIGKSHINFWIAVATLLVNFVFNYLLIPKYGINGAAMTSAVVMWVSGILSYILFIKYQRELE
jgi:O-antigen/teichoic acid export membrane protein